MTTEVSIVIPAYNEEKRLGETLHQYHQFLSSLGSSFEIIVVCNGCTDTTPDIAHQFAFCHREVRVLDIPEKVGKGGAIREGVELARGDRIAFADADGATPAPALWGLVQELQDGYQAIIGSRWLLGSQVQAKQTWQRRLASRVFNLFVRLFFALSYNDTQCGAKVFRAWMLRDILPRVSTWGFTFDVDLLWRARQKGYRVKEVPIVWSNREFSSLELHKDAPRMLWELLHLRFHYKARAKPDGRSYPG